MFTSWQLAAILAVFFAFITFLAWLGETFNSRASLSKSKPWTYSLGLTIYASSWMLYGSIGQAATSGWLFLSIFLGPLLSFIFAWPLIKKIFRISKAYNLTSIADFIASRYGKWQPLAVIITLFTLIASLGYLALQLKAITMTFNLLTSSRLDSVAAATSNPWYLDLTFYLTLTIAGFTILFGTRHLDATERHSGLLQALAVKSLLKLVLFLILGAAITWVYFDGFKDLLLKAEFFRPLETQFTTSSIAESFLAQTFLAMLAVILLPHMFHVSVVESSYLDDTKHARWFLPSYLVLLAVFIMPIATAGLIVFADSSLDPDALALGLPLAYQSKLLAIFAFIAGLTAVVSMAVVSSLATSVMLTNELALPLMLRKSWQANNSYQTFGKLVLRTRRLSVLVVMLLAYLVYLLLNDFTSLAALGFLCLAAIGQLAPAALGGLIWSGGNRWGAAAGLILGGFLWFYTLILPSFAYLDIVSSNLLNQGPWGISWLKPTSLFGLPGQGFFSHGVFWSLSLNLAAYILVSRLTPNRLIDRIQASAFVDNLESKPIKNSRLWKGATKVRDLRNLAERFMSTNSVNFAFINYATANNLTNLNNDDSASIDLIQFTERLLASVLGATSARIVMHSALKGKEINLTDVVSIVDEASQVLEFNRSLLHSTLENLSQGVCVIDQQLNLVVWNQAYLDLFDFPEGFIYLGCPATDLFSFKANLEQPLTNEKINTLVKEQLNHIQSGLAHSYIQKTSQGSIIAVQANPMPGGGFVFSYQDITQQKQTEAALIQSENNTRIYTDSVPALIAYFDTNIHYLFMNKSYEEAMGIDRNLVVGKAVYDVLKPEDYLERKPYIEAALLGKKQSFELELNTQRSSFRYALVTYTPHVNPAGDILGFFALYQDITQRKQIETALQETNEHLEERVRERTLAYSELNTQLFTENQIRAQAEEEMRLAKQQAETANASKTHFLAAASHDLLQPLNAARLFASVLTNQVTDTKLLETTQHLDNSLKAAEELLSTLLDISKLDAGAIQPKINAFALDEILSPLTAEFNVMAEKRGLELKFVPTKAWVKSDPQMLRRIIQNFLSNALRYTSSGKVLLGCRHTAKRISIEVWDTGPGIPQSRLTDIFQEFRRLDTPDKHNEKGLGLGLSIAERMAKVLGHQISVSSEYGKGTVFRLSLNKVARQIQPITAPQILQPNLNNLAGVNILCIDNEPLILEGMQALLEGWNCQVSTAANEQAAVEQVALSPTPIDIYLADYHLDANKTGVEALKAIEKYKKQALSGIIITADRTAEIANEINAAGYLLLHKPVKPAALRASITRLVQSQKYQG